MERDKLHFTFREIDGYNKAFNFVISEREAGKSTAVWLDKAYKGFINGRTTLIIRRQINDITDVYIHDIENVINKFADEKIEFEYKKGNLKDGIVDIYIKGKIFARIIALSNPVSRIKSLMLPNIKYIIFDEFICNTRFGEKYLKDEAIKFFELFNTFQREASDLRCYFLGNPYSLYNPYFVQFEVNTKKLQRGTIQVGINWVVQCYEIKQELRDFILARNPLYQFDNAYTQYAFNGLNINDINILLADQKPQGFALRFVFKVDGKYIAVYSDTLYRPNMEYQFYCEYAPSNISRKRDIYCFDFAELVDRTCMLSMEDRFRFNRFKNCMRNREVAFKSIEVYYLIEEVYYNL